MLGKTLQSKKSPVSYATNNVIIKIIIICTRVQDIIQAANDEIVRYARR